MFHASKRYSATIAGDTLVPCGAKERLVVTNCRISSRGTNAGTCQVWFSATATSDTAATAGEDIFAADDDFIPSATSAPGSRSGPISVDGPVGEPLRVTITGNLNCTVMVEFERKPA